MEVRNFVGVVEHVLKIVEMFFIDCMIDWL